jgi:hypothetical protein
MRNSKKRRLENLKRKNNACRFSSGWCFSLINGKLAEIHFKEKFGIYAYCYIDRKSYSKCEQKMIDEDIKKCRFSLKNGTFYDKIRKTKHKLADTRKVFPEMKKYRSKIKGGE